MKMSQSHWSVAGVHASRHNIQAESRIDMKTTDTVYNYIHKINQKQQCLTTYVVITMITNTVECTNEETNQ